MTHPNIDDRTLLNPFPKPKVNAKVRTVPAKRSAVYDVPIDDSKRNNLVADIKARVITLKGGTGPYANSLPQFPKTLAAVDAVRSLLDVVRAELVEQGVEE